VTDDHAPKTGRRQPPEEWTDPRIAVVAAAARPLRSPRPQAKRPRFRPPDRAKLTTRRTPRAASRMTIATRCCRQCEAPGTIIIDTGERYLYLVQPNDLVHSLRHWRRAYWFPMVGRRAGVPETGVAGLARAVGNGWTAALSAPVHGGRSGQSPRRASPLSRSHRLPHPRNEPAGDNRARRFIGMLSSR
jgi:hypothetical protein